MGRKKAATETRRGKVLAARVSATLARRATEAAGTEGRTVSGWLERLAEDALTGGKRVAKRGLVQLRVSDEQAERWKRAAGAGGVSAWLRGLADGECARLGVEASELAIEDARTAVEVPVVAEDPVAQAGAAIRRALAEKRKAKG